MARTKKEAKDYFWLSYSDLMTSIFFVMLVLFVLVYIMQQSTIGELKAKEAELERIRQIEEAVNNIDPTYFIYDKENKKHILNMSFIYPKGSADISTIIPDKREDLLKVGNIIKDLVLSFSAEDNVRYLIVIEGQSSKDNWQGNDDLSFHRAQSLSKFWEENNIGLDKIKHCEIVIAGSGEKGIPRSQPDEGTANQRFLITIIPKIGKLEEK